MTVAILSGEDVRWPVVTRAAGPGGAPDFASTLVPPTFACVVPGAGKTFGAIVVRALHAFGVVTEENSITAAVSDDDLVDVLRRFAMSLAPLGGRAVIVVDGAQHLNSSVSRQLQRLADRRGEGHIQIVLCVDSPSAPTLGADARRVEGETSDAAVDRAARPGSRAGTVAMRLAAAGLLAASIIAAVVMWAGRSQTQIRSNPRALPAHDFLLSPASAARAPTIVLEPSDAYVVAVAAFKTPRAATVVVEDLGARGIPAFVRRTSSWHAVVAGPFASEEEARGAEKSIGATIVGTRVLVEPTNGFEVRP